MNNLNLIRRMNFFQLVGGLFKIYKVSFKPLTIMTLINVLISMVLLGLADVLNTDILKYVALFLPILYAGPILVAMSNTVLGNKVSVSDSYRQGLSIGLVFQTILVALIPGIVMLLISQNTSSDSNTGIDFSVFYGAFFLLMPVWIFFPMISQLEKKKFFPAVGRTIKLYFQNFFRIIGIILLCLVFAIPVLLVAEVIAVLIFGTNEAGNAAISISPYTVPLITMFAISLYVMAYYETRARRENFTADELSQELGFAPLDEMMTV